jgi:hypothetical protein
MSEPLRWRRPPKHGRKVMESRFDRVHIGCSTHQWCEIRDDISRIAGPILEPEEPNR